MHGATSQLARFVSELQYEQLPPPVISRAKSAVLNFAACAVAGCDESVVTRASEALRPYAGIGDTTIIGRRETTDAITASFLNGLAGSVLAFDDTHARALVHPVGPVAAAALAVCEERHLSGSQLVAALVAGVEVACRTSMSISVAPARGAVGWSQTGVCGVIGAAAAVARLLALGRQATCDAIALGANSSAGLRAMNGTAAVTVAASHAASNGYRAALLAASGAAGEHAALEHAYGFVGLYAQEGCLAHLTEGLGSDFALCDTHFKPYPCAIVAHAAIDAARDIKSQPGFSATEVDEVIVSVHPSGLALGDRQAVANDSEASVSIQYWVATALLRDDLGPGCLKPAWLGDPARQELQRRVRLEGDEALPRSSATIAVRLKSKQILEARIADAVGSARRPMTSQDIETKFANAAGEKFGTGPIRDIVAACSEIDAIDDISQFMRLLRP